MIGEVPLANVDPVEVRDAHIVQIINWLSPTDNLRGSYRLIENGFGEFSGLDLSIPYAITLSFGVITKLKFGIALILLRLRVLSVESGAFWLLVSHNLIESERSIVHHFRRPERVHVGIVHLHVLSIPHDLRGHSLLSLSLFSRDFLLPACELFRIE